MSYVKELKHTVIICCAILISLAGFPEGDVMAGSYLNSAHGNTTYGVKRSTAGFPADYTRGLCGHCHEQHGSIGGAEPAPAGGSPSLYSLFYNNHANQTDNFCFQCHTDVASYQTGGNIINRSYSYRAGDWNADTVNDILESFSFANPPDSTHYLDDVLSFITGKWNYTADSNPCSACHNPHAAQGDPANAGNSPKSAGTRGWPVSRPSQHTTSDNAAWGVWGDGAGEKMNNYSASYQAPLRFTSNYEPDGSLTQNGSNLTDYATFCTDCHNNVNTISSTPLGRNLNTFDWNVEKHGKGNADDGIPPPPAGYADASTCTEILAPYQVGTCGAYVLACTDCHEPHGSPNLFLIRKEVNGAVVTVDTGTGAGPSGNPNTEWVNLCNRCHNIVVGDARHDHPAVVPGGAAVCSGASCHGPLGTQFPLCTTCHNHGNSTIVDFFSTPIGNWGDQLF